LGRHRVIFSNAFYVSEKVPTYGWVVVLPSYCHHEKKLLGPGYIICLALGFIQGKICHSTAPSFTILRRSLTFEILDSRHSPPLPNHPKTSEEAASDEARLRLPGVFVQFFSPLTALL